MTPGTIRQRIAGMPPRPDGPIDLAWADDLSLSAMSKAHRQEGLWAFDTRNANAWAGANKYLERTQTDFVAKQETKLTKVDCTDAEQIARNSGWRTAIGPCTITAADGKSAGVAICGRPHVGMKYPICKEVWPKLLTERFMLKHVAAVCKGGVHIG